jgi:hydrogenase nickel incorporation protein HypA/HybF
MHEYGLCEGIVDAVRRRAGGRPVAWVRIRAGARQGVDVESMSQAFHHVAAGTEAADASVDLVAVPLNLLCEACGAQAQTHDVLAVCPHCGSDCVNLTGGDELTLESIGYAAAPATT